MNRKSFLQQTAILSATALIAPSFLMSCMESKKVHPLVQRIGIQLYSVKEKLAASMESTLASVARAGFQNVEIYGWQDNQTILGKPIKEFKNILKQEGLSTYSGHYLTDNLIYEVDWDAWKKAVDTALLLEQSYVIIPWMDVKRMEGLGINHLIDTLNKAGAFCQKNGLKLAYHNHDFEFQEQYEGKPWMYHLLEKTDSNLVDFQADIYWVYRGGANVKSFLTKYADRIKLWHVKDANKEVAESISLGQGVIPFNELLKAPYTNSLTYPVFELEYGLTGDDFEQVLKNNYDYMVKEIA